MLSYVLEQPFLGERIPAKEPSKSIRGFSHRATGRLLCPRTHRDEFDEDPERYSRFLNHCIY
jgi:hypothetical protein